MSTTAARERRQRAALGRDLLRAAVRRRWLLASALVAGAVATALPLLAPAPPATTAVLSAARDLPAGAALTAADLVPVALPDGAVPAGALTARGDVEGRLLAGPVRAGEALTDVRLVGPGLLAGLGDGLVAVPVRLADPASAALLRGGDRVDVLAAGTDPGAPPSAAVVAAAAPVLAVPAATDDLEGALVLLATPPTTAGRLAAAAVSSRLSVVVRP